MGLVGVWTGFLDGVDFVHDKFRYIDGCRRESNKEGFFLLLQEDWGVDNPRIGRSGSFRGFLQRVIDQGGFGQ